MENVDGSTALAIGLTILGAGTVGALVFGVVRKSLDVEALFAKADKSSDGGKRTALRELGEILDQNAKDLRNL